MPYVESRGAERALLGITGVALLLGSSACTRVDSSRCHVTEHEITDTQSLPGGHTVRTILDSLVNGRVQGYWSDESPVEVVVATQRAEGPAIYRLVEYERVSIFSGFASHREDVVHLSAHADTGSLPPGGAHPRDTGYGDRCEEFLTIPVRQTVRTLDDALSVAVIGPMRTYLWEGAGLENFVGTLQVTVPLDASQTVPPLAPTPADGDPYLTLLVDGSPAHSMGYLGLTVSDAPGEPPRPRSTSEPLLSWY